VNVLAAIVKRVFQQSSSAPIKYEDSPTHRVFQQPAGESWREGKPPPSPHFSNRLPTYAKRASSTQLQFACLVVDQLGLSDLVQINSSANLSDEIRKGLVSLPIPLSLFFGIDLVKDHIGK
jgi:hypothetical protein